MTQLVTDYSPGIPHRLEGAASTERLYAIAFEWYSKDTGEWNPKIEYMHGDNCGDVAFKFSRTVPLHMKVKVIGVSKVVGYFVKDNQGDILSA